jgi:hypothetical protein
MNEEVHLHLENAADCLTQAVRVISGGEDAFYRRFFGLGFLGRLGLSIFSRNIW